MHVFCTLFDSFYIDKGIALINSLNRVCNHKIYVLATDAKCYDVLDKKGYKSVVLIKMEEFESSELLSVKNTRTKAEYYWTCTPSLIEFILLNYQEEWCTYLDSDIYFLSDPSPIFAELNGNSSVIITEHRFPDNKKGQKEIEKNGRYCVQFNSFKNDEQGRLVLGWWKEKCLDWCFSTNEKDRMGDQKYLNNWTEQFNGVHVVRHPGAGVAYWNFNRYVLKSIDDKKVLITEVATSIDFNVIFCHFQNIKYISKDIVNIRTQSHNKALKQALYFPYLKEIESIRIDLISNHNLSFEGSKTVTNDRFKKVLQKYFARFKIFSFSDLVRLKKLR